mmetsp:Transcript_9771/g.14787  ORF Transcript_9771/g.14787 Transcript_9771/m.14787 type:complete len:82 (+) Transcript_9771:33-278(+)
MSPLYVLEKCIGSYVRVLEKNNGEASGVLEGFDAEMNIILRKATLIERSRESHGSNISVEIKDIPLVLLNGANVLVVVPGE